MEEISALDNLLSYYYSFYSAFEVGLLVWNFVGSVIIMFLAFWRIHDLHGQKHLFNSNIEYVAVKGSMVLLIIGAMYHAIDFTVPSFREGCTYSGVLIYLLFRRIKQLRDANGHDPMIMRIIAVIAAKLNQIKKLFSYGKKQR